MGQKDGDDLGALESATVGKGNTRELDSAARLAIVQARLDGNGATNTNINDTPFSKAAHGFWLDNRIRA